MGLLNSLPGNSAWGLSRGKLSATPRADARRRLAVEIGARDVPGATHPHIRLSAWDDECVLRIGLRDQVPGGGAVSVDENDVFEWRRGPRRARIHAIAADPGDPTDEGGLEFSVRLDDWTDDLVFDIETQGLAFHYQPALTAQEIAEGCERPDNVVDLRSLSRDEARQRAQDYRAGKVAQDYRAGKVAHIYRPWVEDAIGARTWCDLTIDEQAGEMRIAPPLAWLATAEAPFLVDPTFGYTTTGASTQITSSIAFMVGTPGTSGSLDKISAYMRGSAGTISAQAALYSSSGYRTPNALLGHSGSVGGISTTAALHDFTMSGEALTGGTNYYVAIGPDAEMRIRYDAGSSVDNLFVSWSPSTWPDPAGSGSSLDRLLTIYGTYTESGASFQPAWARGANVMLGVEAP